MTKAQHQAREYAAEADVIDAEARSLPVRQFGEAPRNDAERAADIAHFLRCSGEHRAAAYVIAWQESAAKLPAERRRHNDAMNELLERYYTLRDGPPRPYDREGKPPAESSD